MRASPRRAIALILGFTGGCLGAGEPPRTHHYTLIPPGGSATFARSTEPIEERLSELSTAAAPRGSLVVDDLGAHAAYLDRRMAYRTDAVRLDRYAYHEWAAAPPVLVADHLRDLLAETGLFSEVVRAPCPGADARLTGRVTRFEEVDVSADEWLGVVALELRLVDPDDQSPLFEASAIERVPLDEQSPAGLARALSHGVRRIVARVAAPIARRTAAARAPAPSTGPPGSSDRPPDAARRWRAPSDERVGTAPSESLEPTSRPEVLGLGSRRRTIGSMDAIPRGRVVR